MTEGKWYPIFIYSEKNKGAHNTIMHSKQIVITVALPIANVCEFNYIHSNYNDNHYWTNPKISLIRTGAGPKLFGLVRFHCILHLFNYSPFLAMYTTYLNDYQQTLYQIF